MASRSAPQEDNESDRGLPLQAIFDCLDEAVITTDARGHICYLNAAAAQLTGVIPAQAHGQSAYELLPAAQLGEVSEHLDAVLRAGQIRSLEGSPSSPWLGGRIAPLPSANGDLYGAVLALRESADPAAQEIPYRTLVENALVGVYLIRDDRFAYVNPQFAETFGYSQDKLIGCSPRELVVPAERARVEENIRLRLNGEVDRLHYTFRGLHRDGSAIEIEVFGTTVSLGGPAILGTLRDITAHKAYQTQIERLAYFDELTDLPNSALLQERGEAALTTAPRGGTRVALLYLELERFHELQRWRGQGLGQTLLQAVAARINGQIRPTDTLARVSEAAFALLLPEANADTATMLALGIHHAFHSGFDLGGAQERIGARLGIACFPEDGRSWEELYGNAQIALWEAKARDRTLLRYRAEQQERLDARLRLERDLEEALQADQLTLWYQPIIDLESERPVAVEALVRWAHPRRGWVPPNTFIPLAERTGQIHAVSQQVLELACAQAHEWHGRGHTLPVAINISARDLEQPDFVTTVRATLGRYHLPGAQLVFEITETEVMADVAAHLATLQTLHQLGIALAIDDFGTGYSSLGVLQDLPVDRVKIDKSFVGGFTGDPQTRRRSSDFIKAIIALTQSLGFPTIAEGVADRDTAVAMRALGCCQAQGFFYGRPAPAQKLEDSLHPFLG